jgi:hypothetical protein
VIDRRSRCCGRSSTKRRRRSPLMDGGSRTRRTSRVTRKCTCSVSGQPAVGGESRRPEAAMRWRADGRELFYIASD